MLALEIATHDEVPTRVAVQPAFAARNKLVHFGIADPVVLAAVEHRNQNVEMGEQFRQGSAARQGHVAVGRVRVDLRGDGHLVVQRFEQIPRLAAASTGECRDFGGQRQGLVNEFRSFAAPTAQGAAEDARDGDAHEGRRGIGPVVDVVRRHRAATAHQRDGIDIEQQRHRAPIFRRLGIEDMRLAERQFERLDPCRILVQQESQVRRGAMGGRDREQHGSVPVGSVALR